MYTLSSYACLLVLIQIESHVEAGVLCYSCDLLPHQRDCDRVVECGASEECYGEKLISDDGLTKFKSGCRSKTTCAVGQGILLGKRADLIPCSKCCNTPYCNLETCDTAITRGNRTRCLSCEYALTPTDCNLSIQCNEDEVCYSQSIIHNQERRYRLGCVHKNQCGTNRIPSSVVVGKRATSGYCGQCCDGGNCNRELCPGVNIATAPLVKPPPLRFCRDNSTSFCSTKVNECGDEYYKYYQCPATCQQCGNSPIVTVAPFSPTSKPVTVPTVPTIPTTIAFSLAQGECRDNPNTNCISLVCGIPSLASDCQKTCNLCGGVQTIPTTIPTTKLVTTRKPATTTLPVTTTKLVTTTQHVCEDPIPRCQCKYLDTEANLCSELTAHRLLRKYCCYYCNEKRGRTQCPNNGCERIEAHEKEAVANMQIGCIDSSLA